MPTLTHLTGDNNTFCAGCGICGRYIEGQYIRGAMSAELELRCIRLARVRENDGKLKPNSSETCPHFLWYSS